MDKHIVIGDRYELIRAIDGGGTSHIVLANDIIENRHVCLKILRTEHIDDEMYISAFNAEIDVLKSLDHDGIVKILDSGRQGNVLYYVMDIINGKTLKKLIEEESLSIEEKVNICLSICDIMQYSHDKGILHKDLKSANVMVRDDMSAVVLDFGTEGEAKNEDDTELLGTVEYFSPEQALGESLDKYSDTYSMGVLMYELFTGRLPFEGKDNVQIALKQVHQYPDDPKSINSDIPESLNRIILKALRKNKKERYPSFSALYADIEKALEKPNGKYVKSYAKADIENGKENRKHTKLIIFGIVGLIIALLTVSTLTFFGFFSKTPKDYFMPALENHNVSELESIKKEYKFSITFRYESDETLEDGIIISQEPEAGKKIKLGESIILTINSNNNAPVLMINAVGKTLDEAVGMLTEVGVSTDNIEIIYVQNQSYDNYTVVDQYPEADESFSTNDGAVLYVNNIGSIFADEVPLLTGYNMDEAIKAARDSGFKHVFVTFINYSSDSGNEPYTVVSQYPTADIMDFNGETLELTVVNGKNALTEKRYTLENIILEAEVNDIVTVIAEYELNGVTYEFILDKFTVKEADENIKALEQRRVYSLSVDDSFADKNCILRIYKGTEEEYFINY